MKWCWISRFAGAAVCAVVWVLPAYAVKTPPKVEERTGHKLDYSASVVFGTDYVFRGVSLSDESFALQGTLDLRSSTGLYVGAFGSNVDFNDGDEANTELDFYGGYAGKFTDSFGYNLNITYSTFPGADDDLHYDNIEYSPSLTYLIGKAYLHGGLAWSPDYFGNSGDSFYYDGNVEYALPYDFSVGLHGGYQFVEENDTFGAPDYRDWAVSLTKSLLGFQASVTYADTDLSADECFGGADTCDSRVVFSIGGHGLSAVRSRNAPIDAGKPQAPSKPGKTGASVAPVTPAETSVAR
jgi:uncharacterized protein (TIGR02001 family)